MNETGAYVAYKLGSLLGIGAAAAALVVMLMRPPRGPDEWRATLVCTVVCSIFGGAFFIRYFDLVSWLNDYTGCIGLAGVIFAAGLPGYVCIKWFFDYAIRHKDSDPQEIKKSL